MEQEQQQSSIGNNMSNQVKPVTPKITRVEPLVAMKTLQIRAIVGTEQMTLTTQWTSLLINILMMETKELNI